MARPEFVHLALRTAYSLSEGAIHIDALADHCKQANIPAISMTDTNNLFGALEFSETMCAAGIQPLIGCSLAIASQASDAQHGRADKPAFIRLIAQDEQGYGHLLKLVTSAHLDRPDNEAPHVPIDDLLGLSDGLIMLTGGADGPLGRRILARDVSGAAQLLQTFKSAFGDRLYMELARHGMANEKECEASFLALAFEHDVALVATNDVHFLDADMFEAHDALLCIADGTYVSESQRRRLTPEHSLKSADEMAEIFADLPEAIENTVVIAERCAYRPLTRDPILPNYSGIASQDEPGELRGKALDGLKDRLRAMGKEPSAEPSSAYFERLEFELKVIIEMGFAGYFLIVADFIGWAKRHKIPVGPGRGSGAGSVVAWALQITNLDPLRFGLLFERFLNPERVSMPDFDIDFCQEKRDQVIHYVQEKYGADHVAQIITFGKLQARAVLRDVGRVLQQPYPVTDRLCKLVPNNPANPVNLSQAIKEEPRFQQEIEAETLTAEVVKRALKLEGLYRHASTHAAGVVIGDRPLHELVPLYRDPRSDMPVTQFNMKWVEKAGLVKFDFLGLKTLSVLDRTGALLRDRNIALNLDDIPLDDPATFELLARGDTAGVFQLESSGMRAVLVNMRPDTFEDIIALVALYRPGPMDNIPTYINRKHDREDVNYLHDSLEEVLKETYGVIIYQEQVMQIAQILAGYTLGEADLLRRAMGKKIKAEMDAQRERFVEGAKAKGVDQDKASFIFDLVAKFAGYGFNKSHAAAYAMVAYQTAYCKANYPVEFMAATMSFDQNNTDKLASIKNDLRQMGIELRQPDINRSGVNFSVVKPDVEGAGSLAIRYALAAIKNVGEKAMRSIIEERDSNGEFKNIFDLAERIDSRLVNKRQMENLIAAGAFDGLEPNRALLMRNVELFVRHAHAAAKARSSAQTNLFGAKGSVIDRPPLAEAALWSDAEKLKRERDAIGFFLSAHPLEIYADMLAQAGVKGSATVLSEKEFIGKTVRLAGAVDYLKERRAAKSGNRYAFFGLSDMEGSYEAVVFSNVLDAVRDAVDDGGPVVVTVEVQKRDSGDGSLSLLLRGIEALEKVAERTSKSLHIFLDHEDAVPVLSKLLGDNAGGKGMVQCLVRSGHKEIRVDLPGRYKISPELKSAIATLHGVEDVQIV